MHTAVVERIVPCKEIRKIGRQIDNAHTVNCPLIRHLHSRHGDLDAALSASASQNHCLSDEQDDDRASLYQRSIDPHIRPALSARRHLLKTYWILIMQRPPARTTQTTVLIRRQKKIECYCHRRLQMISHELMMIMSCCWSKKILTDRIL